MTNIGSADPASPQCEPAGACHVAPTKSAPADSASTGAADSALNGSAPAENCVVPAAGSDSAESAAGPASMHSSRKSGANGLFSSRMEQEFRRSEKVPVND